MAFRESEDCTETECRLVDAGRRNKLPLRRKSHACILKARESAATLAQEVDRRTAQAEMQQRFTEAIVDSLPLSLVRR